MKQRNIFTSRFLGVLDIFFDSFIFILLASACRNKIGKYLARRFHSPKEAIAHYFPDGLVIQLHGDGNVDIEKHQKPSFSPTPKIKWCLFHNYSKGMLFLFMVFLLQENFSNYLYAMKELKNAKNAVNHNLSINKDQSRCFLLASHIMNVKWLLLSDENSDPPLSTLSNSSYPLPLP